MITVWRDSSSYVDRERLFAPILAERPRVLIDGKASSAMVLRLESSLVRAVP